VKKDRCLKPRKKKGNTIGRLLWILPSRGELFYLRRMLIVLKGPLCYANIITVQNIVYLTFREACFASGSLDDDFEFIEAIKNANDWSFGH